jgi:hypothetical protein
MFFPCRFVELFRALLRLDLLFRHTAVKSESAGRLHRVVTNLNFRAACGRAMENESKHASFKLGLATEMKRVDASHKEIHGDRTDNLPTAQTHDCLCLKDDLPWVDETDGEGNHMRCKRMASAPSRDYFLSTAVSAVCNLRLKQVDIGCDTMVGMVLIAMCMCSHQHLHAIGVAIKGDPGPVKRIQSDLPGTFYEISERLFPGKFWGGKHPGFSPSGFDFKKVFVENKIDFQIAVGELKELLKFTNTTHERSAVTALIKEMADSSKLPGLNVVRLQLFIPLAALCGLVLPEKLQHADYIEPAEGHSNGSFSILNKAGFERHRHADTLLNICGQVGLLRRLSLGECLTCESHRSQKRFDLFLQGQDLFHLFLMGNVCLVKRKRCNSNEWESMSMFNQTRLGLQSDPPVEDAGVTEKQAEEGGWQQLEGCVDPALGWSWGPDGNPAWRSSRGRDGQGPRNHDPEPEEARAESTAEMEDNEEQAADDPEPEEALLTQAESTAEMEDNEEEAAEPTVADAVDAPGPADDPAVVAQVDDPECEEARLTQAKSIAEMEDKEEETAETMWNDPEPDEARLTQAESIAEMEDKEEEAAETMCDDPEPEEARLTQAESIAEMEDKEEEAAETMVAPDTAAAEPVVVVVPAVVPAVDTEFAA